MGYAEYLRDGWEKAGDPERGKETFDLYDHPGVHLGDDLSKSPPMSHQVGWVRTDMLDKHKDFDRATDDPAIGGERSRKIIDAIKDDMRPGGRGLGNPVLLEYHPDTHSAWLGEGNHRLAAAKELGHPALPTRIVRAHKPGVPVDGPQKLYPNEHDYFPASAHPADVLPDHYLWTPPHTAGLLTAVYDDAPGEQDVRNVRDYAQGQQSVTPVKFPSGATRLLCDDHRRERQTYHDSLRELHHNKPWDEAGMLSDPMQPGATSHKGQCADCEREERHTMYRTHDEAGGRYLPGMAEAWEKRQIPPGHEIRNYPDPEWDDLKPPLGPKLNAANHLYGAHHIAAGDIPRDTELSRAVHEGLHSMDPTVDHSH